MCARALAGRSLKVIHHVVSLNQNCGIPGRFFSENVSLFRENDEFANELNLLVAILSWDQEKPFDRVDWSFFHSYSYGVWAFFSSME